MQLVNVGGTYLVVKEGVKLTDAQIRAYQAKPTPDLTLGIWSEFPDFNPGLSRSLNKELATYTILPTGPINNELKDNSALKAEINKRQARDGKKYVFADYTIQDWEIPSELNNAGVHLSRETEFYTLKYDDAKQETYWEDESGNRVEFNRTRAQINGNSIKMFDKVISFDKDIEQIIAKVHNAISQGQTRDEQRQILSTFSDKEKQIYVRYIYQKEHFLSPKQKHFSLAHELKHMKNHRGFGTKRPQLSLENRLRLHEHDEKSAHIAEILAAIKKFYDKGRDFEQFPTKAQWLIDELKTLSPQEQDTLLKDMKHIVEGTSRNWDNDYGSIYRAANAQFDSQITNDAWDLPLREFQNSDADLKQAMSITYSFEVYNPDTKQMETRDLSSFVPAEQPLEPQQVAYLNKAQNIIKNREDLLRSKGITPEIIEQIIAGQTPDVFDTQEILRIAENLDTNQNTHTPTPDNQNNNTVDTPDSGHQKPENMPHQPDPIDESFKEPYRKFYQAVAAKEHSQYHEDTQSPNFSAGLKRQNGEELNITATADNQISLQAKDKDQKPKIPDYKDFDDLVKLAKSQGQTISLGNIKSPEFKARLILACLENNVAVENMPDWSKLQGLEPETKQRLAKQKIAALRQMVHDKNQKGEYAGLSKEESDKRNKLEQARATIREARKNNQTQNNPSYDEARAAVIARQKELKGR